jgi:hypothetical protein
LLRNPRSCFPSIHSYAPLCTPMHDFGLEGRTRLREGVRKAAKIRSTEVEGVGVHSLRSALGSEALGSHGSGVPTTGAGFFFSGGVRRLYLSAI